MQVGELFAARKLLIWGAVIFFLSGCTGYHAGQRDRAGDATTPEATALYDALSRLNDSLTAFKALGVIQVRTGVKETYRSAWAGQSPDRMRLQVLGITGQPVFSFSRDGHYVYYLSHQDGRFYRRRAGGMEFERFTQIPIDTADLLSLIFGRLTAPVGKVIPRLEQDAFQEMTLVWQDPANGHRNRVYWDRAPLTIREMETTDTEGRLLWRASLHDLKNANGYRIPGRIRITGAQGAVLDIKTERFWTNPAMASGIFILEKP